MKNTVFEFERVRVRDLQGRVSQAGARWRERTSVNQVYRFNAWVLMVFAVSLIGLGLWAKGSLAHNGGLEDSFVLAGMIPGAISLVLFLWPAADHWLIFTADGKIMEKRWWKKAFYWGNAKTGDISLISAVPSTSWDLTWTEAVEIVTLDGDTFRVADHLHPVHARKVTVELNLALTEIRALAGSKDEPKTRHDKRQRLRLFE